MSKEYQLYDIYVLKSYGIPIFAGCTGSDYCREHHQQHELHVGFFSAMQSFSKESFNDTSIQTMLLDKIQLNFKTDEKSQVIIVFVHPFYIETSLIQKYLNLAMTIFLDKYFNQLKDGVIRNDLFKEFQQDLKQKGIIPNQKMHGMTEMQKKVQEILFRKIPDMKKE